MHRPTRVDIFMIPGKSYIFWTVSELLNIYFSNIAHPLFQRILPVLEACSSPDNPIIRVPEVERFRLAKMVTDIAHELSGRKTGYEQMAWGIMYQLLVDVARYAGPTLADIRNPMNPRIAEVIDWLNAHYRETITLSATAKTFKMAESSLSRAFHQSTRFTFTEYLSTVRLKEACRLLLSSDMMVSDIANYVLFANLFPETDELANKIKTFKTEAEKGTMSDGQRPEPRGPSTVLPARKTI